MIISGHVSFLIYFCILLNAEIFTEQKLMCLKDIKFLSSTFILQYIKGHEEIIYEFIVDFQ